MAGMGKGKVGSLRQGRDDKRGKWVGTWRGWNGFGESTLSSQCPNGVAPRQLNPRKMMRPALVQQRDCSFGADRCYPSKAGANFLAVRRRFMNSVVWAVQRTQRLSCKHQSGSGPAVQP